jgi:hypothetical protein
MITEHMKQKDGGVEEVGSEDGCFWMSLTDLFLNFESVFLCRWFNEKWTM